MSNLFSSEQQVDFWVWVDPRDWLVRDQIQATGGFTSGGLFGEVKSNLMFIPNPDFRGQLTPFHWGIMRDYMAEYNLELGREAHFRKYPSRLNSIYLFESKDEAQLYRELHKDHVSDRILKKVKSVTPCLYSKHDLSWVDFLRLTHSVDAHSVDHVSRAYWSGVKVENCVLESMGEKWTQSPVIEVLFLGRIEFYNRNLDCGDLDGEDEEDS